jgi:two-component sensor histidine kinase
MKIFDQNNFIGLKKYAWLLGFFWLIIIVLLIIMNMLQIHHSTYEMARNEARGAFLRDIAYRLWNAQKGGVYVPINERTKPNPHLSNIPERDIITDSGRQLTLMNPAFMTRQVHELAGENFGIISHITSLNPIRPENKADSWETEALKAFEQGELEVSSVEKMEGGEYLRLMRPLKTEQACLRCHSSQGYQLGDIRGGISITISTESPKAIARHQAIQMVGGYTLIWLIGILGIIFGMVQLKKSELKRNTVEDNLKLAVKQKETLLIEVHHRVKNNLALVSGLLNLQSKNITDQQTKKVFLGSQQQVHTIAKLHELFYQSKFIDNVNMKIYLSDIVNYLCNFFEINLNRIKVVSEIESIELDSKKATSCGLILNELFTNAFKHGLSMNKKGNIHVKFVQQNTNKVLMSVFNSGEIFPADFDISQSKSMGLQLVTLLTNQLGGKLTILRENGTTFLIEFGLENQVNSNQI